VFLVVDGHPAHKANRVTKLVGSMGGRLELHFLASLCAGFESDEFVWSHMKPMEYPRSL